MTVKKQWRFRRQDAVKPMSAQDLTQKAIYDAAMKAAIDALRPTMDPNRDRMVRGLSETEIYRVVCAVIEAYVKHYYEHEMAEEFSDDISDVGIV